ncbi:unnamed protein product, partial [Ascophyllum nodosum]
LFRIFKKVVYSDICCSDKKMLQATLGLASSTSGGSYRGPRSYADQKRLQCGGNRQGGSGTAGDETLGNWCGVAFVGRFVCN